MKTHLKTTWMAILAALALLFGLSLAGCAGDDDSGGDTANNTGTAPKGGNNEEDTTEEDTEELTNLPFVDADPITGKTLARALQDIKDDTRPKVRYTITLNADEPAAPVTLEYPGRMVDITLQGNNTKRTVRLNEKAKKDALFRVKQNVTLTLKNITLKGRIDNTMSLVVVESRGTLIMESGSGINGNSRGEGEGGGVFVDGTFTMNNGEINNNTGLGGGVFVNKNGIFTMNNGEIFDNRGISRGGGVCVYEGGTFTMNGGEISNNTVTLAPIYPYGGGVCVDGGTFTMNNGKISDNTKSQSGGGVYVNKDGTFALNGGEISGNTARSGGGGVQISTGTFVMKNGTIKGNDSGDGDGGGVSVDCGAFSMENGTIKNNICYSSGGGVSVGGRADFRGVFTMRGGTISGNTTKSSGGGYGGGGVKLHYYGAFTMSGGEISGNTTASRGGGVFAIWCSSFIKTAAGGVIYGNNVETASQNKAKANDSGHAVYYMKGSGAPENNYRDTTVQQDEALSAVTESVDESGTLKGTWGQ